jgi:hypothetical protein
LDGETARVARGAALTRGVMGFLAILTLGMPLVVVAAYYAVGWKAAVLAFPLLLMGLGRLTPSKNQDEDANRRRIRKRFVTLTILYAVPAAAVWWDNPEIMRVWAYATVLPFSLFLASDGKGNISRTATILAGVIFVALSDLVSCFRRSDLLHRLFISHRCNRASRTRGRTKKPDRESASAAGGGRPVFARVALCDQ